MGVEVIEAVDGRGGEQDSVGVELVDNRGGRGPIRPQSLAQQYELPRVIRAEAVVVADGEGGDGGENHRGSPGREQFTRSRNPGPQSEDDPDQCHNQQPDVHDRRPVGQAGHLRVACAWAGRGVGLWRGHPSAPLFLRRVEQDPA
jgi:hypothetical protein